MLALAMDVMFAIVFGPERSLCNFGLYYSLLAMVQHIEIVVARSSMWSNRYFEICPWICAAWLCGNICKQKLFRSCNCKQLCGTGHGQTD